MKVSYNWLSEVLNLKGVSHDELFKLISTHIVEIEEYKKLVNASMLEIGHVVSKTPHPDSDHLNVCQVKLHDGIRQIVCGASNVDVNQFVIVALPGAVLPGNFTIKPTKVRGIESNGMICSLQELGIDEKYVDELYKNGIYVLGNDASIGGDPLKYLGLDDYVINLELTSNRSDLLSIEGVSFDLGAVLNQKPLFATPNVLEVPNKNMMDVRIETNQCFKYHTRYVSEVTIKDSPNWMKARLIASGIRPINNVVDITNYVLIELGQPLHAFDADLLGNKIVVRNARHHEKLVTLDNIERTLEQEDIVIANDSHALCIGGVMGGASTQVTKNTKNIVLEAAYFSPASIRKTSSRLGLKSESSTRFERKIDPNRVIRGINRACELLIELADAKVYTGISGVDNYIDKTNKVEISLKKINGVLGTNLTNDEVENIFTRLGYDYVKSEGYIITIPSRRMDLECGYQDIIEDVARMYGYNNIPTTLAVTNDKGSLTIRQKAIRNIRTILSSKGLNEAVTYSLINENNVYDLTCEQLPMIKLLMPMSEDRAVMRQSLLNGLMEAIKYNKARRMDDLALFEIGKKYSESGEELLLSGAICGLFSQNLWQGYKQKTDFFLVKGILEDLFTMLGYQLSFVGDASLNKNYHPGRTAKIYYMDVEIGMIGQLHPAYQKANDLSDTYVFEINLDKVFASKKEEFNYKSISKYPSITRDLAIVCKKEITASQLIDLIKSTSKKLLVDYTVFDVYEGANVSDDEKSIAIKLVFQDQEKTLETSDVDKIIKSILNRLDYNFKAYIRS